MTVQSTTVLRAPTSSSGSPRNFAKKACGSAATNSAFRFNLAPQRQISSDTLRPYVWTMQRKPVGTVTAFYHFLSSKAGLLPSTTRKGENGTVTCSRCAK